MNSFTPATQREDGISPFELVVFDMAGTTVLDDGVVEKAFSLAAERADLSKLPREDALAYVRETMGQSKIEVFRALSDSESQAQEANQHFEDAYRELIEADGVEAVPGAEDLIRSLRDNNVSVALTTGFSPETRDALLTALGWNDLVDIALSPSDVGRGRPFPDLALTALLKTGASSVESMIIVGDTASDIRSGLAAGASLVVGVLTGAHDEETLMDAGAHRVVESVTSLNKILALD